jgi:feruloyl esterase
LVAIQRYPADYDGVIAIEPAITQQAHQVNLGQETMRHVFADRKNWLSPANVALYAAAEIKACDGLDGLKDGVIGNVAACDYLPTELRCTAEETDSCLTDGQIESIRLIYADHDVPVTFADGRRGYPRFGRGGAATSDWVAYIFGTDFQKRDAFNYLAPSEAARVVERNADTDALRHEPEKHAADYQRISALMDATDPDLSAFAGHGGKLLIWYGLADTCVSVYQTARYFAGVEQRMGKAKVRSFARFLVSPGVGHELDGPGANDVDLISAMDRWVEQGMAPDALVAKHVDHATGAPGASRPVCDFPRFPRYSGYGDSSVADNFTCAEQ